MPAKERFVYLKWWWIQKNILICFCELEWRNLSMKKCMKKLRFAYHIYCKKSADCLNKLRHQIYCPRGAKISFELLHPCLNVWRLNANRANHQAKVWRSNLDPHFTPPFPIGHGWQLDDQGNMDIDWMKCNPTSEEVRVLFQIS